MKFLIFFIFLLPFLSHTQGLSGIWTFSGAGCRNATTLSDTSHISIPFSKLPMRMAILNFTNNNITATMTDDEGVAEQREVGYTISNNKVILTGMPDAPDIHIQGDSTLISVNKGYSSMALELCCDYDYVQNWRDIKRRDPEQWSRDLEENDWDEDKLIANDEDHEEAKIKCRDEDNKVIAYVIGKVD